DHNSSLNKVEKRSMVFAFIFLGLLFLGSLTYSNRDKLATIMQFVKSNNRIKENNPAKNSLLASNHSNTGSPGPVKPGNRSPQPIAKIITEKKPETRQPADTGRKDIVVDVVPVFYNHTVIKQED